MRDRITIIDYGMGNLRSVQKKFQRVGAEAIISSDLEELKKAKKLVLPGIGHFSNGVNNLKKSGIWEILNQRVLEDKIPILGICLGMQLMAKHSEEGNVDGLGWFDAEIVKFSIKDKLKFKVPHMGWNSASVNKNSLLFKNVSEEFLYYFVHSYHINCNDEEDILTTTKYEYEFTSSIQKNNIYGTQFHPEKSHDWGELLYKNFANI